MDLLTIAMISAAIPVAYDLAKEIAKGVDNWVETKLLAAAVDREEREEAITAFSIAVSATEAYMEHLMSGGKSSRRHEGHLSMLWDEAYHSLRPIVTDPASVEPLRLKAEYWDDPESWSEEDVEAARIGLSQVKKELKKYLRRSAQDNIKA